MRRMFLVAILAAATTVLISSSAADVKENYSKSCAKCHGSDGKGQTKIGRNTGARDYTDPKVQAELKEEEAFKAIKDGKNYKGKEVMKAFSEKYSDPEITELLGFMRTFGK